MHLFIHHCLIKPKLSFYTQENFYLILRTLPVGVNWEEFYVPNKPFQVSGINKSDNDLYRRNVFS